MLKQILVFAIAFWVYCVGSTEGKRFSRCGLVHELRRQGFAEKDMRNWVCLIENESARTTDKVNVNRNGSRDFGLFQINDMFWCSDTRQPGKDCHVTCADVMTDNITKASACAKKIFKRHGFNAWYGWKNHCQGALPDIKNC